MKESTKRFLIAQAVSLGKFAAGFVFGGAVVLLAIWAIVHYLGFDGQLIP